MLKNSLRVEKRKEPKTVSSKTPTGDQNIGNCRRDACSQVLGRQTRRPVLMSGGIIGRWGKIVWILVRNMISVDVCGRGCGGKCHLETVWDENWKNGMPHRDRKRLDIGAEGVKSVIFRVLETKCLFCGMREADNPKGWGQDRRGFEGPKQMSWVSPEGQVEK